MAVADVERQAGVQRRGGQTDDCLDLLFCLAFHEANFSDAGPAIDLYRDLLHTLYESRASQGPGWTHSANLPRDPQAVAALDWIHRSCRSKLQRLHPADLQNALAHGDVARDLAASITASPPVQLYLVTSGPREREAQFQKLKSANSCTYAYHGSAVKNWSSILRHGLKNLSHTARMAHGAVRGNGVYLTPSASLASTYSDVGQHARLHGQEQSLLVAPELLRVVAFCEVVNVPAPGLRRTTSDGKKSTIWVAEQDGIVAVRLLFVYPEGSGAVQLPSAEALGKILPSLLCAAKATEVSNPPVLMRAQAPRYSSAMHMLPPINSVNITTFMRRDGHSRRSYWVFCIDVRCSSGDVDPHGSDAGTHFALDEDKVWRRYSQFEMLRDRIGDGPRARFPAKMALRSAICGLGHVQLERRRRHLEQWLREVVSVARHGLIREELVPELCAFLGVWVSP